MNKYTPKPLVLTPDNVVKAMNDLRTPADDECEAPGPQGLVCTRPQGHDGPVHAAHVQDEPVAVWVETSASYKLIEV